MTALHRDLSAPEIWQRSFERSRRRRATAPKLRRQVVRRKRASTAMAAAMLAGPAAQFAGAQTLSAGSGSAQTGVASESPANRAIAGQGQSQVQSQALLQVGSAGGAVAAVQGELGITANGIFDEETERAVRDFQAAAGLEVDGIVGPQTWGALFGSGRGTGPAADVERPKIQIDPAAADDDRTPGSAGGTVAAVQRELGIPANGIFDEKTERAVRDFQATAELEVDGIVGPQTWGALFGSGAGTGPAADVERPNIQIDPATPADDRTPVGDRTRFAVRMASANELSADELEQLGVTGSSAASKEEGDGGLVAIQFRTPEAGDEPEPTRDDRHSHASSVEASTDAPKPDRSARDNEGDSGAQDEETGSEGGAKVKEPEPQQESKPRASRDAKGSGSCSRRLVDPLGGKGTFTSDYRTASRPSHAGIDLAAPSGTPIRAAACGVISHISSNNGYGNFICVKHSSRFTTCYAHLSRFSDERMGDRVRQGEVIGYVGSTGHSTGPHLHFETRTGAPYGRNDVDPKPYLKGREYSGTQTGATGGPDLQEDGSQPRRATTADRESSSRDIGQADAQERKEPQPRQASTAQTAPSTEERSAVANATDREEEPAPATSSERASSERSASAAAKPEAAEPLRSAREVLSGPVAEMLRRAAEARRNGENLYEDWSLREFTSEVATVARFLPGHINAERLVTTGEQPAERAEEPVRSEQQAAAQPPAGGEAGDEAQLEAKAAEEASEAASPAEDSGEEATAPDGSAEADPPVAEEEPPVEVSRSDEAAPAADESSGSGEGSAPQAEEEVAIHGDAESSAPTSEDAGSNGSEPSTGEDEEQAQASAGGDGAATVGDTSVEGGSASAESNGDAGSAAGAAGASSVESGADTTASVEAPASTTATGSGSADGSAQAETATATAPSESAPASTNDSEGATASAGSGASVAAGEGDSGASGAASGDASTEANFSEDESDAEGSGTGE